MVHVSNINTLKKIYYVYFHSIIKYGIIFRVTPTVGRFRSPPAPKKVRIMAGAQPRPSSESLFKQFEILPVPCQHILYLITSIQTIRKFLKQNHQYMILIQGQMPNCLFPKKYNLYLHQNFQQLPCSLTILKNGKAKLKAAFKKYLNPHSLYSLHEFFYV